MKERAGIQSVEVGFGLLQALGEAPGPLMLRDLARAANMSAAKAHRYLVSFQRLQLVVQDPASTRYDLGPAALKLGLAALERLDAVKLGRERAGGLAQGFEQREAHLDGLDAGAFLHAGTRLVEFRLGKFISPSVMRGSRRRL